MIYYEVPKGMFLETAIETIRKIAKEKSEVVKMELNGIEFDSIMTNDEINKRCSWGDKTINKTGLLPCPFCGGQARAYEQRESDGNCSHIVYIIRCTICLASTRAFNIDGYYGSTDTMSDAYKVWNRRVNNA